MTMRTEHGLVGRCVQDVVTDPARKWARIQGDRGHVEWHCGYEPGVDAVSGQVSTAETLNHRVRKTRPDDFIEELRHLAQALEIDPCASPISIRRGLETMLLIAAAHKSNELGRRVRIDYDKGFTAAALA